MVAKNILEEFIDKRVLAVLKLFLYEDEEFYLREVARKTKTPVASTHRIIGKLKILGLVEEVVIKKTKLYHLARNKNTKLLGELLEEKRGIVEEFVETVANLQGVEMIVMHGEESKDKTNIIVIGQGIDAKAVKDKVGDIKEKHNFNIIELVLEPLQFNQMSSMGLFPSKKVILWELPT